MRLVLLSWPCGSSPVELSNHTLDSPEQIPSVSSLTF